MPDRTQEIKNLRAVAQACKLYCDESIESLKWELGTYDLGVDTVNGTTSLLPTPANTIQATMVRVDGKSEVSENLVFSGNIIISRSGIYVQYVNTTGAITCSGTSTDAVDSTIVGQFSLLPNTTYTFKNFGSELSNNVFLNIVEERSQGTSGVYIKHYSVKNNNGFTFTTTNETHYMRIAFNCVNGADLTNLVFKPMLVVGSTAPTDFKAGFSSIHNLELTGIKSEGSNLFDGETELGTINVDTGQNVVGTAALRCKNYQNVIPNKTYTLNYIYRAFYYDSNYNYLGYSTVTDVSGVGKQFTTPYNCAYVRFNVVSEYGTTYLNNIRLNLGSTLLAYVPYITPTTLPIDLTTILYNGSPLFEGNSLKGVNDVKDSITPYKATKKLGYVDLGTLNYTKFDVTQGTLFRAALPTMKYDNTTNLICAKYETVLSANRANMTISKAQTGSAQIDIIDNSYTTVEAFKTAMSGVYLVYELATPIEVSIDWSDKLVKFEAYSNGSITLANTNNQDTTSTFKYLKEVAK